MIRTLAVAGLAATALCACSPGRGEATAGGPYAGLDREILAWRNDIEARHAACAAQAEGKGCVDFQVMCKAAQEITPDESARGVSAQVVAAMTFAGRNLDGSTGKSGSSFALFSKSDGKWIRTEAMPVHLSTCAPL